MPVGDTELVEAAVSSGLLEADALPKLRDLARRRGQSLAETVTVSQRFPRAALYRALALERGIRFAGNGQAKGSI